MLWLVMIHPGSWRERSCDEVIDHERGVTFQLTLEEDTLTMAVSERMQEMRTAAGISPLYASRYLTQPRLLAVRDHVFAAISDKRHGDASQWRRLATMDPCELSDWIEEVWRTVEDCNEA